MESKKIPSLEKLCLEIICQNLNTLKYAAKNLPSILIDDLHQKSIEHYTDLSRKTDSPSRLPADLFFHAGTKAIHSLDCYDQPPHKIVDRIYRLCKKLRTIHLTRHTNRLQAIVINNPNIVQMKLVTAECKDKHLFIIGKHCPQLRSLKLFKCTSITDKGMNYLPKKLVSLGLPKQISVNGHLNALERLPHLKRLETMDPTMWYRMIQTISDSRDNRYGSRTYEIEEILLDDPDKPISENFPRILGTLFTKLRSLKWCGFPNSDTCHSVAVILEAVNYNLLTRLELRISSNFIQIAAYLCPMLEELNIRIDGEGVTDDRYLAKPKHVPFKYLRKFDVWDFCSGFTVDDFKCLMVNCHNLAVLCVRVFSKLTDQVIYDVLSANRLKCLEDVAFNICGPFSCEALCELLKSSSSSLKRVTIWDCKQLSLNDKVKVETLIEEMNWHVSLIWPTPTDLQ